MKITERLKTGEYVTYENVSEYLNMKFLRRFGCSGCCLVWLLLAAIIIGLIVFAIFQVSAFLSS